MNPDLLAFLNLGPVEIVLILLVALLVFGRRLPEVARSLGQGMVEFKKGLRDEPGDTGPRKLPERDESVETSGDGGDAAVDDVEGPTDGIECGDPERPPEDDVSPAG